MHDLVARQVRRQRPHRRRALGCGDGLSLLGRGGFSLQLLQRELKLLDLAVELLGPGAELHPAQPRDLHAQRLDQQISAVKLGAGIGKSGVAFGKQRL